VTRWIQEERFLVKYWLQGVSGKVPPMVAFGERARLAARGPR